MARSSPTSMTDCIEPRDKPVSRRLVTDCARLVRAADAVSTTWVGLTAAGQTTSASAGLARAQAIGRNRSQARASCRRRLLLGRCGKQGGRPSHAPIHVFAVARAPCSVKLRRRDGRERRGLPRVVRREDDHPVMPHELVSVMPLQPLPHRLGGEGERTGGSVKCSAWS
jgi:hypothetical protein